MDESILKALRSFSTYSAGRFDVYSLAGDSKAKARQQVMSELMGAKVPRAKCGINAIKEEFQRRLGVTGATIAEREGNMIKKARAVLAGKLVVVDELEKALEPKKPVVKKVVDRRLTSADQLKDDPATLRVIELLEEQKALLKQLKGLG